MGGRVFRVFVVVAIVTSAAFVGAAPAAGSTVVSTDAELRAAFADLAEDEIVLGADIVMDCEAGGYEREDFSLDPVSLTLDGAGHTVTNPCTDDEDTFTYIVETPFTVEDLTILGGSASGSAINAPAGVASLIDTTIDGTGPGTQEFPSAAAVAAGDVHLVRSTVRNSDGVGVFANIFTGGQVTAEHSTVEHTGSTGIVAGAVDLVDSTVRHTGSIGIDTEVIFGFGPVSMERSSVEHTDWLGIAGGRVELVDSTVQHTASDAIVAARDSASLERSTVEVAGGTGVSAFDEIELTDSAVRDVGGRGLSAGAFTGTEVEGIPGSVTMVRSTVEETGAVGIGTLDGDVELIDSTVVDTGQEGITSDAVALERSTVEATGDAGVRAGSLVELTDAAVLDAGQEGVVGDLVRSVRSTVAGAGANGIHALFADLENSSVHANGGEAGVSVVNNVRAVYSTITDNVFGVQAQTASAEFHLFATTLANSWNNCDGPWDAVTSFGFNWSDDTSCGLPADEAHPGGDPRLGPLGDHGGHTPTRLPLPNSPLIDAIPVEACQQIPAAGITTDQRGIPRPSGPGCDIGAVEITDETVTFTAHYTEARCGTLEGVAEAFGVESAADVVRAGVNGFMKLALASGAFEVEDPPSNDGPCEVPVTWSADHAGLIADTAAAWGLDPDQLQHSGGTVVLVLLWIAIQTSPPS